MEDKNICILKHLDLDKLTRCPDDCSNSTKDLKDIKEALENNDNLKHPLEKSLG